jgi:hypothetical protein
MNKKPARGFRKEIAAREQDDGKDQLHPSWDKPRPVVVVVDASTKGCCRQNRPKVVATVVKTGDDATVERVGELDDI